MIEELPLPPIESSFRQMVWDILWTIPYGETFSWTGTTNLGSYFISSTSSHYDWAIKKIKTSITI